MDLTTILITFTFIILALMLFTYLSIAKRINIKFKKNKLINIETAFTYPNIIKYLGGIENIEEIDDNNKIKLVSTSLVNLKSLKKLGLKVSIEDDKVSLYIKGFDLSNFYRRLKKDLSNQI